jgi:hypothetical protein
MPFNTTSSGSSSGGGSSSLGAQYNATPPTYADGATSTLQTDNRGRLLVDPLVYNAVAPTLTDTANAPLQGDVNGNLKVNAGIYNTTSFTQAGVTVPTTTGGVVLLLANPSRTYVLIQNQGPTNNMYISWTSTDPTVGTGFYRLAAGGTFIQENNAICASQIKAIAETAAVGAHVSQAS